MVFVNNSDGPSRPPTPEQEEYYTADDPEYRAIMHPDVAALPHYMVPHMPKTEVRRIAAEKARERARERGEVVEEQGQNQDNAAAAAAPPYHPHPYGKARIAQPAMSTNLMVGQYTVSPEADNAPPSVVARAAAASHAAPVATPAAAPGPAAAAAAADADAGDGPPANAPTGPKAKRNNKRNNHPRDSRPAIMKPSAASGGIPTAKTTYLTQACKPAVCLERPKPLLVIMDLNGTLLHRPDRTKPRTFNERAYAKEFTAYCLDTFTVVVWSSARPANVEAMCDQLFQVPATTSATTSSATAAAAPPAPTGKKKKKLHKAKEAAAAASYRNRVVAVWGRDKFGLTQDDYNLRVQVYKRLELIWGDPAIQAAHPRAAEGHRWDQTNTVLVDDSVEKARSEPYNLVEIPEFTGLANEEGVHVIPQVHDYINNLAWQADVSCYIRENPFTMDPSYKLTWSIEK